MRVRPGNRYITVTGKDATGASRAQTVEVYVIEQRVDRNWQERIRDNGLTFYTNIRDRDSELKKLGAQRD
jgi:hypothetical protein